MKDFEIFKAEDFIDSSYVEGAVAIAKRANRILNERASGKGYTDLDEGYLDSYSDKILSVKCANHTHEALVFLRPIEEDCGCLRAVKTFTELNEVMPGVKMKYLVSFCPDCGKDLR